MRIVPALIVCLLSVGILEAQEADRSRIVLGHVPQGVMVLLDGRDLGASFGDTIEVDPGMHVLERVVGNRFRWTIHRIVDTLEVGPGEIVVDRSTAEAAHVITSRPEGASVMREGEVLGRTPYLYRDENSSEGTVTLTLEGYEPKVLIPSRAEEHVFLIEAADAGEQPPSVLRDIRPPINNKPWTITSAVVMIGSSVAAAYLKEKANRALEEYQRTGSPAALDDVRAYDNYSAIAAATLVVSFSGFALFLTTE